MKTTISLALLLCCAWSAGAQPTASPTTLTFTNQVNSATILPANPQKFTVSLPSSASKSTTLTAAVLSNPAGSTPPGWLATTADPKAATGFSVYVNPTSLAPGTYSGIVKISTSPNIGTTSVTVTLAISTAPSLLLIKAPPSEPPLSDTNPTLTFAYTTGDSDAAPTGRELDVASNGGIIPFTVTASAATGGTSTSKTPSWLRVNVPNQYPTTQTSGVALSGSYVPITVSVDRTTVATLDVGTYTQTVTIQANTAGSVGYPVSVVLNVAAGAPKLDSPTAIFPASVVAGPAIDPVITIYGDNFFANTSVFLTPDGGADVQFQAAYLSRKLLQITVQKDLLALPGSWTLKVMNGNKDTGPQVVTTPFTVLDPAQPVISSVLNAASYLKTASQTGTTPTPVPAAGTGASVAPREIISIFGQHLGPADVTQATVTPGFPDQYPTQIGDVQVLFQVGSGAPIAAPLIMASNNQVNAIVPTAVKAAIPVKGPNATIQVANGALKTDPFPVTVVAEDPGIFTFGGLGTGQAAVLNYDITTGYTINGSKAPAAAAARNSTIVIYATGLGDFAAGTTLIVTDSSSPAQTATTVLPITINSAPTATASLKIVGTPPDGTANVTYPSTALQAQGGTPPYRWVATGVPPGLGLSSGWVLTGKPSAAGSFSMTVTVTDSSKPALSATTTFTINIAMTMTPSLPGSVTGAPYPTTTLQAWGGTVPYVWSATGLPTWLSLDPATGVLSAAGNPSAAGTSTFQITVKDGSSPQRQLTTTYSVTIVTGMLITTDTTLPGGVPNVPYPKVTLAVAGGTAPYTWTAQTVLPDGLTLDKDKGELSGTPSLAGSSSITILVTDSATPAVTATATFTLAIASLSVTTAALPDGAVNVPYSALVLQAAGGTPPYRWSATSLPAGLSLSTTGVLSGTPITEIVLPLDDGDVALGAVSVADNTYRVTIDGQAAVVPYAGASKGSVAGLVQINAVVPATARPTNNVPLTVTIGNAATARTSQINVVIAVK